MFVRCSNLLCSDHEQHGLLPPCYVDSRRPSVVGSGASKPDLLIRPLSRATVRACSDEQLNRGGVSLIEVLVSLSVIALLLSLTLPAILNARATSRRCQCANNLRQIGVALAAFEASHRSYPGAFCGRVNLPAANYLAWCISPQAQLTLFTENKPEAEAIRAAHRPPVWDVSRLTLNAPPLWKCPDDNAATAQALNYRFTRGLLPLHPGDPTGVFTSFHGRSVRDITDGLSHTAFASERLVANQVANDPNRDPILVAGSDGTSISDACIVANQSGSLLLGSTGVPWGSNWLSGSWDQCCYYHLLPPNSHWSDCGTPLFQAHNIPSARSHHAHGVSLLFGDGKVTFAADKIDLSIWRAWGTRNGSEILD